MRKEYRKTIHLATAMKAGPEINLRRPCWSACPDTAN